MQLHQLLVKTDADAFASLLHISADMVKTVLHIGNARDKAILLPRDLPTLVRYNQSLDLLDFWRDYYLTLMC